MRGIKIALIAILGGLILALTVGMIQVMNGRWDLFGWQRSGSGKDRFIEHQAILQSATEYEMTDVSELEVDCSKSNFAVIFVPGDGDKLVLEEYCTKSMGKEELAKVSSSEGSMTIRQDKSWRNINLRNTGYWAYLKIFLPQEAYAALKSLSVGTDSGDISFPEWSGMDTKSIGLQSATFSSGSGDIEIAFIRADMIQISSGSGSQTVEDAAGQLHQSASSGDVYVNRVKGDMEADTDSGYITVREIDGQLRAGAKSGDVTIDKVTKDAQITTTSGLITVSETRGSLSAGSDSGDQRIGEVAGNVKAESTSGNQTVNQIAGDAKMSSSSGDIRVESMAGKGIFSAGSGSIEASVTQLTGDISVSSGSGDVVLLIPAEGGFHLDVNTTSGDIQTAFDKELEFNEHRTSAEGDVGNGGEHQIGISTSSGNVRLHTH